jgi:hypothetical protein
MTALSQICYDFIDGNPGIFELNQYDIDHTLDRAILESYTAQQTCSNKYFDLLKYIYEQSTYISCQQFIEIYEANIDEIIELSAGRTLVVFFPIKEFNKSYFFFTLYFLHRLREKTGIVIEHIYPLTDTPVSLEDSTIVNPFIVTCDDFSYGGSQLMKTRILIFCTMLSELKHKYTTTIHNPNHKTITLVPPMTH